MEDKCMDRMGNGGGKGSCSLFCNVGEGDPYMAF